MKEKTLAAHRAGIKRIIIPQRNKKDLVDIPREVARQITFFPARTVEDVLKAALAPKAAARRTLRKKAGTAKPAGDGKLPVRAKGSGRSKSPARRAVGRGVPNARAARRK